LQTDPIRFSAGDANLYRYVANNPVNAVDPEGTFIAPRPLPPSLLIPQSRIYPPIPIFPLPPNHPNVPASPDNDPNYDKRESCHKQAHDRRDACDEGCKPICDRQEKRKCLQRCSDKLDEEIRDCNRQYPSNPSYPPITIHPKYA